MFVNRKFGLNNGFKGMSALGQKQTFAVHNGMSALPPMATSIAFFGMSALDAPLFDHNVRHDPLKQTFGSTG